MKLKKMKSQWNRRIIKLNNLSVVIEIILYADDYPKLSHTKIASHFSTKFGLKVPIGQSTIGIKLIIE